LRAVGFFWIGAKENHYMVDIIAGGVEASEE
jgi:hypothetical protein